MIFLKTFLGWCFGGLSQAVGRDPRSPEWRPPLPPPPPVPGAPLGQNGTAMPCSKEQQRPRQQLKPPEEVMACPRCQSLNTKFCYYNNYSLTQPRHFCKNCRRYWTAGGTLRNVPVGGGCRKIKRSSCKSSTTTYHHLHQHQHQQHTAAALAANSDHAAIIYDSPP
ncbi:unnamed protein product, partial [Sphagnum jensenii]